MCHPTRAPSLRLQACPPKADLPAWGQVEADVGGGASGHNFRADQCLLETQAPGKTSPVRQQASRAHSPKSIAACRDARIFYHCPVPSSTVGSTVGCAWGAARERDRSWGRDPVADAKDRPTLFWLRNTALRPAGSATHIMPALSTGPITGVMGSVPRPRLAPPRQNRRERHKESARIALTFPRLRAKGYSGRRSCASGAPAPAH